MHEKPLKQGYSIKTGWTGINVSQRLIDRSYSDTYLKRYDH